MVGAVINQNWCNIGSVATLGLQSVEPRWGCDLSTENYMIRSQPGETRGKSIAERGATRAEVWAGAYLCAWKSSLGK